MYISKMCVLTMLTPLCLFAIVHVRLILDLNHFQTILTVNSIESQTLYFTKHSIDNTSSTCCLNVQMNGLCSRVLTITVTLPGDGWLLLFRYLVATKKRLYIFEMML